MENSTTVISSRSKQVRISRDLPTVIIGERINPTGRKGMQAAILEGNYDIVRQDALAQVDAGASILDVNAGVPGVDEAVLLTGLVSAVSSVTDVPICIDTADPKALAAALELYEGKALVNSVNGEKRSLAAILPLVAEFGAAVIALCMDDDGIPATPNERLAVAEKILDAAVGAGIPQEDLILDPLVLSLGADSRAGTVALDTCRLISENLGLNLTMGASNVSFGLPDRKSINTAFITMAIQAGVTCPITNPLIPEITTAILAADLALGRDQYATRWIRSYRQRSKV